MSKEALYTLLEGENVIFELNHAGANRSDQDDVALKALKHLLNSKQTTVGVFVLTNMRCIVAIQTESGICCASSESRSFWTFPLESLNGMNGYTSTQATVCCCSDIDFTIEIGIKNFVLKINTQDVKNHEQAQALVAKITEVAQKAKKQ